MNNKHGILSIAFVFLVLGFMISVQFKTVNQSLGNISGNRARELASQLKVAKEENDKLLQAKEKYEKQIKRYEEEEAQGSYRGQAIKDELEKARMIAGLENVEGPGLVIVLDDLKFSEKYNYSLIDYTMLLELVNELNAAGAEAISINDQRITSMTEIREAGLNINVNTVKLGPPFTVKVIGDGKTIEAALRIRGGIIENIESGGIVVTVTQSDNVVIKKFNGAIELKFAKPVQGEVKK